jgi:phosphatidylserine synthase
MQTVAVVSLVIFTLIIAAAALGLSRVIMHLRAVAKTLDALDGGVKVIVEKTSTVGSTVDSVNSSLAPVRSFAESI